MKITKAELIKILHYAKAGAKAEYFLFGDKKVRMFHDQCDHYLSILLHEKKDEGEK